MSASARETDDGVDDLLARVGDGRPVMSSWSLAKAMAEPENETVPISTPSSTSRVT